MQLIVNIKDQSKASQFLSYLKTLDYIGVEKVDDENEFELQQWHKDILDDRLKTKNTENYISAKDLMTRIRKKYGI